MKSENMPVAAQESGNAIATELPLHSPQVAAEIVAGVDLFAGMTGEQQTALVSRFREDTYPSNAVIFREQDAASRFWIVKSGQVKIVRYGLSGREVVIEVIPAGEVFGGAVLMMPSHPATAMALSDCTLLSISRDQYVGILQEYPAVAVHLIEMLGARLYGVIQMRTLAAERVDRRIAHILLKMAAKCGVNRNDGYLINVSLTRKDIAELADTTLETAIRVMSVFRQREIIRTLRGGYILIQDERQLRDISET